ncbi:MAG: tyrosine-protein phosphatase [Planctomycetes bacterium]|nr:tyrosine-protein phosphatase [Planctomycetota bacterium]
MTNLRHRLPLLLLVTATACTGFRAVRPDVFRSPQPGEDQLARRIAAHDIRTVVCLRGPSDPARASERAATASGAAFWHVPMSATRLPRPETLLELWHVADAAPRPLLLHCRAGVDRTGLAAAIVVLHDTGNLTAARAELRLVPHGHLGAFGTEAMGEVLDRYERHAAQLSFPDWVRDVYAAEFAAAAR